MGGGSRGQSLTKKKKKKNPARPRGLRPRAEGAWPASAWERWAGRGAGPLSEATPPSRPPARARTPAAPRRQAATSRSPASPARVSELRAAEGAPWCPAPTSRTFLPPGLSSGKPHRHALACSRAGLPASSPACVLPSTLNLCSRGASAVSGSRDVQAAQRAVRSVTWSPVNHKDWGGCWRVAGVVELLPCEREVLSANPRTSPQKKRKIGVRACLAIKALGSSPSSTKKRHRAESHT
jgi:hypothetical protein